MKMYLSGETSASLIKMIFIGQSSLFHVFSFFKVYKHCCIHLSWLMFCIGKKNWKTTITLSFFTWLHFKINILHLARSEYFRSSVMMEPAWGLVWKGLYWSPGILHAQDDRWTRSTSSRWAQVTHLRSFDKKVTM